jgi:hypothetical protein
MNALPMKQRTPMSITHGRVCRSISMDCSETIPPGAGGAIAGGGWYGVVGGA